MTPGPRTDDEGGADTQRAFLRQHTVAVEPTGSSLTKVKDMGVQTLARMQRLFVLVLSPPHIMFYLMDSWSPEAVQWLRKLPGGGDSPYRACGD